MGNGKQYVSWLHADDWCGIIHWFIENENTRGVYNLCAPNPLPNHEMMRALRQACAAPLGFGLPQPYWLLEFGAWLIRTETELIIKSRRVVPVRLLQEGYKFQFSDFQSMIHHLKQEPTI